MHDETRLEGSYRRLLWAYPRFYRRHRGVEIVTTMLEAAKPGQVRPTRAEAMHLILSGLKVRLVPPRWAGKIAASVITLWVAIVLGATGAYTVWSFPPGATLDPSTLDGVVAAGRGVPGQPAAGTGLEAVYTYKNWGDLDSFGDEGWAGERPAPGGAERFYEQVGPMQQAADAAYRRLRDQGWRTGEVTHQVACDCPVFWASRDGVLVRVLVGTQGGERTVLVAGMYLAEPGGVLGAAIAGFVIGLVLVWPMMTWLTHRFARTPRGDRILALLFGLPVLYACVANTVDNVLSMVPDPDSGRVMLAGDLIYPLANQAANPLAATVIALGLAACVAVTTFTPWQRRHPVAHSG